MLTGSNNGVGMQKKIVSNDILVPEIARLVAEGSKVAFTPKGVSMLPFIRGDRDTVLLAPPVSLNKWDIVLAKAGKSYVLHRIIDLREEELILMGDGNLIGVERCRPQDVIAVAEKIIKGKKEIDCHSKWFMRQTCIWQKLKPLRRWILAIYKRIFL